MTQGEIEKLAAKIGNIFSRLEVRIMKDIIRRIKENGFVTASADWQISRLKQLGESEQTIKQLIQDALGASDEELERIFSDEVYEQYYGHAHAYELANMQQVPLEENEALQRTVEAMKEQLRGEYRNLTGSMGFAFRGAGGKLQYSSLANAYRTIMDNAVADITSGAFDYNTVLKRTVSDLTSSGLRWIDYDSGRRDRVDVAARRAVLTGFRQVQGKINEQVAAELHTDMYEVSYHVGARPSHQPWQGKVWSMEQLKSICGLGSVTGLCGANCYHDYKPFPPGSVRTYTDDQLAEMAKKENATKQYNGREYNTYEALQQQRKMERVMRAQREKIKLLEEGGADPDDIILAKARYQGQMQTYRDFSKKMQLPEQKARIMQDGLRGQFMPTKAENVKAEQLMQGQGFKNITADKKQFAQYQEILGEDAPKQFADFQRMKYNEPEKWTRLKKKKTVFSEIAEKEWSDEFKDKARGSYKNFESEGFTLSAHALSRLPRLNKKGFSELSENDILKVLHEKPKYLEGETKAVFFDEQKQISIIQNRETKDIVSIVRRKNRKEEWKDV